MKNDSIEAYDSYRREQLEFGVKASGMSEQNIEAFRDGLEKLGCTHLEFYDKGIKFDYLGEIRKETYQQCMIYILNGAA